MNNISEEDVELFIKNNSELISEVQSLIKKRDIERKAYDNYYYNCWHNEKKEPMTFNKWYLTDEYKIYIRPLLIPILRKLKLKKIEKADI